MPATAMPAMNTGAERRRRLEAAQLYLVCGAHPGGRPLAGVLRAAISGGVRIVQLRDKGLGDEELSAAAAEARATCADLGALLIVNDRPAVAVAAGADGVHLGQEDISVAQARALVGEEMLIGLSTHTPSEIEAVRRAQADRGEAGADYIGVGPVFATPTKPGRPAVGTELVRHAATRAAVPFFAVGGIGPGQIGEVVAAGARRVAVVRAIAEAADPRAAALTLHRALGGGGSPAPRLGRPGAERRKAVAAG